MTQFIIERLTPNVRLPRRATAQSAGYDLEARFSTPTVAVYSESNHEHKRTVEQLTPLKVGICVYPGERALVPLGFKATLPDGYEAQIRPRSGVGLKFGVSLVNAPGTVDADFPNEWHVIVENRSQAIYRIAEGQAIAQMVLAKYEVLEPIEGVVVQTTERVGGYGSTDGAPKQVTVSAAIVAAPAPVDPAATVSVQTLELPTSETATLTVTPADAKASKKAK